LIGLYFCLFFFSYFLLHARDLCKDWRCWAQDANFYHHVLSTVQRLGSQSHGCCKNWRCRIGVSTKSLSFFFIGDSLQRLDMLALGRQFLASRVIYSAKRAKIGQSVRVVVAKIGDDGPRTPIFAITCYLQFGRSVHVVVAKIGDAGPRTPIFGVTCYLQREACKDWPVSPRDRCEDWRSWAQDVCKIWRPGPSMTKVLYLIWN
jgi:hypothetical protein